LPTQASPTLFADSPFFLKAVVDCVRDKLPHVTRVEVYSDVGCIARIEL